MDDHLHILRYKSQKHQLHSYWIIMQITFTLHNTTSYNTPGFSAHMSSISFFSKGGQSAGNSGRSPCYYINMQHETRNTKHETRNTKHETRNTKHETRNTKHETRNNKATKQNKVRMKDKQINKKYQNQLRTANNNCQQC